SIGAPAGTKPPSHSPEQKKNITGEIIFDPGTIRCNAGDLRGLLQNFNLL
ncbi:hypothetical protein A2U01_0061530, partial [Trifolium medium]|nr:hypothetical protein [Trifolium medium]